jgi:hypothetical protein
MTNSPIAAESAPGFLTVAPQFTVPDVVAAASYYCDILGFENRGFFGDPPVFAKLRGLSMILKPEMGRRFLQIHFTP